MTASADDQHFSKDRLTESYEVELHLLDGGYSLIDGRAYKRVAGNVYFCRPGQLRKSSGTFRCYYLYFNFSEPLPQDSIVLRYISGIPEAAYALNAQVIKQIFTDVIKAYVSQGAGYELVMQARILEMIAVLYGNAENMKEERYSVYGKYRIDIAKSEKYMQENLSRKLSLNELATVSKLSASYYHHAFKAISGKTPKEYLTRLRLDRAKELLIGSGTPLCKIAYECGFESQEYFQYVFKKEEGITPGKYRSSHYGCR